MTSLTWRVARAVDVRAETRDAATLVLGVKDWPGHDAGQHLVVRLTAPDGYTASRSYSIASAALPAPTSPEVERTIEITVERLEDGEVSPYLVETLSVGDPVEVRGPLGRWFVWRPTQPEPIQLVAGGSGVVPLMSMLRTRRDAGITVPFRLLYSARTPELGFYRDELAELATDENVGVDYVWTREAAPGSARAAGRILAADLTHWALPASEHPTCYVCGSTGFVETVADLLVAQGHDPARIRTERYGGA